MKTLSVQLAFFALLSWGTVCQAGLIGGAAGGYGAVTCTNAVLDLSSATMTIKAYQSGEPGYIGTLPLSDKAYFEADGDPTVMVRNTVRR